MRTCWRLPAGDERRGGGAGHHRMGSGVSDRDPGFSLGSGVLERGVARLFRAKAKITGSVKFTQVGGGGARATRPRGSGREDGVMLECNTGPAGKQETP
jgi:hypothetical protein